MRRFLKRIPLAKPFFAEEEVLAVQRTLESGWVAQGPRVKELEDRIAHYSGAAYGIAVNSCTSALHLSLLAHGVSDGDKVIIPDFTFTATGNAVLHVGAEPVLVDIEPTTFCIDVNEIERKIDDRVKAIIPVHAFGYPARIGEINKIAEAHGIPVIEDAALALGSELDGKRIGSYGNTTCFSLQGRKVVTTGEGGMIVSNDIKIAERLLALRSQGAMQKTKTGEGFNLPIFRIVGFSYRLSDIQACIGLVQMQRIEDFIKRRGYLAEYYNDLFVDSDLNIQTPIVQENIRHNYQSYVVLLKEGNRDSVILQLREKGVESTIGTYSLSAQSLFHRDEEFPNSRHAFEKSLALPMYHELTEDDVNYVFTCLKDIIKS